MKSTEYINWDNLKNIPFSLCEVKDDLESEDIDIYYQGELVLHDDDHIVGHFLRSAIILFSHVRRKNADWLNLGNLWILRSCIRVHCYHGVGIDPLLYGDNFSGDLSTLTPLTKARFEKIQKVVKKQGKVV